MLLEKKIPGTLDHIAKMEAREELQAMFNNLFTFLVL